MGTITQEECLRELEQWAELPLERLAYLMGYMEALNPLCCFHEEVWQRVLPEEERLDYHFTEGGRDAFEHVLYPRLIAAGVDPERIGQAIRSLKSMDFFVWANAQLNPELAQRLPKRMARITALLGARAEG